MCAKESLWITVPHGNVRFGTIPHRVLLLVSTQSLKAINLSSKSCPPITNIKRTASPRPGIPKYTTVCFCAMMVMERLYQFAPLSFLCRSQDDCCRKWKHVRNDELSQLMHVKICMYEKLGSSPDVSILPRRRAAHVDITHAHDGMMAWLRCAKTQNTQYLWKGYYFQIDTVNKSVFFTNEMDRSPSNKSNSFVHGAPLLYVWIHRTLMSKSTTSTWT